MKKIFSFLFLMSLLFVLNVKADAGPPSLPTLKAKVKNDGAKCYEDYEKKNREIDSSLRMVPCSTDRL